MRCDERVLQTLQVNVNSYEGICSRSSLDSGALVDVVGGVGAAEEDSKRRAASARARDKTGEGRMTGDVRSVHVWRSRFAGAGMCSAGEALRGRGADARASARNKEEDGRIVVLCAVSSRAMAGRTLVTRDSGRGA
jgi:hypothetical protein